jgi:hypothetical protein
MMQAKTQQLEEDTVENVQLKRQVNMLTAQEKQVDSLPINIHNWHAPPIITRHQPLASLVHSRHVFLVQH